MPRRDEVLAAMRDALQVQDPEWDISPGSPEWKVLEAVAQQVENITFNSVLNDFHFDVDKKSGLELDLFMSLFGFSRIRARRSTGEVTFSRGTVALQDYVIPLGTQVFVPATAFSPAIYFQTTVSAVLPTGATEVSVPVQSVVGGTIGNVGSYTVTGMATSVGGITAVTNSQAISGGRDAESDEDLRTRWRATVFRNISGTEDQFLALAYNESSFVSRATLIGPIERYSEQVQLTAPYDLTTTSPWVATLADAGGGLDASETSVTVTSAAQGDRFPVADPGDDSTWYFIGLFDGGTWNEVMRVTDRAAGSDTFTVSARPDGVTHTNGAEVRMLIQSSVTDSAYTYPAGGEVVGLDIGLTTQQVGRRGSDYYIVTDRGSVPSHSAAVFPLLYVTPVGRTTFGLDTVVQMEHEYTPLASRNDPGDSRTEEYFDSFGGRSAEKVDLFVDGVDPLTIVEQVPYREDYVFGTNLEESDFLRDDGVNPPIAGSVFTQLSKSPTVAIPSSITVAATATTAATTYYKDEDYYLVTDKTVLEGSPRARNGIEWRVPTDIDFTTETPAFAVTTQSVAGALVGNYSYVVTYEIDGVESLAADPEHGADANVKANKGKNAVALPTYGGAGDVVWRRIYRSVQSASFTASDAGPFYLLAVVKDNTATAFLDNRVDSKLDLNIQPPKVEPPVDAALSIEYSYNNLIERLDAQVDLVRLVGMDTLVHEADDIQLKFNLAVVVVPGMNVTDLKADINTNLFAWIDRKSFQNNIQVADVIDQVSNSSGVDNVRLARESEARNEVQKITVTLPATPSETRDLWTISAGGYTSGAIVYNDTALDVRETLEAMPNIHEGNNFATVMQDGGGITSGDLVVTVTDSDGLHTDNDMGNPASLREGFYIEVDTEVMYVVTATDNGGTVDWDIKRGQLGTAAASHADGVAIHVLGDVAVVRSTLGSPIASYVYEVHFLPNGYSGVNDWGLRELDLVTAAKYTENSQVTLTVQEKVSGSGWGIQRIARNDITILDGETTLDDIYLASDELPSLFGVDVIVKAQNTF